MQLYNKQLNKYITKYIYIYIYKRNVMLIILLQQILSDRLLLGIINGQYIHE